MLHVSSVKNHVIAITEQSSLSLWHRRLGHLSQKGMKILSRSCYILDFNFFDFSVCEHCLFGKQTLSAHKRSGKRKSQILDLVHSDVCGPMPTMSLGGASYFATFIDVITQERCGYIPSSVKMKCFRLFRSLSH